MRYISLILILCIMGCKEYKKANHIVSKKYCVDACLHKSFGMFHNEGKSWGAGSSSMDGLTQSKVVDKMTNYCETFYKGEDCCSWTISDDMRTLKTTVHGYDFGVCQEEIK